MIYVRHYFPGVDLEIISDEDFAALSEDAMWLHQQMIAARMAQSVLKPY